MHKRDFYQEHLDRVSRSFAFCIARLDAPLREWVGLAYLLFRLLDTIEDTAWPSPEAQGRSFEQFAKLLRAPSASNIAAWQTEFPSSLPESEQKLLQASSQLLLDLNAIPTPVAARIRESLDSMSRGMRHFLQRQPLRLQTLPEVNQYCFFVAGLVGELLSGLLVEHHPQASLDRTDGFHFGLFLQKINILKDQIEDQKQGRWLVPSRPLVLASLIENAKGALRYLLSIPLQEKGYRLFCAWSLFLGLQSLPWIDNAFAQKLVGKLPRLMAESLLASVESVILDNGRLEKLFDELLLPVLSKTQKQIQALTELSTNPIEADLRWFFDCFQGSLSLQEMQALRLT